MSLFRLRTQKIRPTVLAYMNDEVKAMFEAKKEGEPNELVFKDRKGKKISNTFNKVVNALGFNENVNILRVDKLN